MFTQELLTFTFAVNALIILQQVTSAAPLYKSDSNDFNKYPIVYRRFVRRRPPMNLNDKYSEEIIEIFHTNKKPSAFGPHMSDADIDKFIFCDFNRHLDECKKYWESRKSIRPRLTTTTFKPVIITTTTTVPNKVKPITTTSKPLTTTTKLTTTTTTTTTEATTEFLKLPQLEENEYDYEVENVNEVEVEKKDQEFEPEEDLEEEYQEENNDYYIDL